MGLFDWLTGGGDAGPDVSQQVSYDTSQDSSYSGGQDYSSYDPSQFSELGLPGEQPQDVPYEGQGLQGAVDYVGGMLAGPAAGFDLQTGIEQWKQALGLAQSSGLLPDNLGTEPSVDLNPDYTIQQGAPMADMTTMDPFCSLRPRNPPWRAMGKRVQAAARLFGPTIALQVVAMLAQCYSARTGLSIQPMDVLMHSIGRRRRRSSGITGRQLSTTRRTLRKLSSMQHYLRGSGYHTRARARTVTTCTTRRAKH